MIDRVSYERDTKIVNAASFTIEREDHTIGNILRMYFTSSFSLLNCSYYILRKFFFFFFIYNPSTFELGETTNFSLYIGI